MGYLIERFTVANPSARDIRSGYHVVNNDQAVSYILGQDDSGRTKLGILVADINPISKGDLLEKRVTGIAILTAAAQDDGIFTDATYSKLSSDEPNNLGDIIRGWSDPKKPFQLEGDYRTSDMKEIGLHIGHAMRYDILMTLLDRVWTNEKQRPYNRHQKKFIMKALHVLNAKIREGTEEHPDYTLRHADLQQDTR
jgi:hypothetical protein